MSILYVLIHEVDEGQAFWEKEGEKFLSPQERERLTSLRFQKRRQEWLHGRWVAKHLIQRVLSDFGELTLSEISIENRADGSPWVFVKGEEVQGELSISHREGWACAAFSQNTEISLGIDVEKIEKRDPAFYMDYFTDREKVNRALISEMSEEMYYTFLWSTKEAALKALKLGLRIDTRKIEILLGGFDTISRSFACSWFSISIQVLGVGENWTGFGYIREQFVMTLACHGIKKSEPVMIQEIRL